MHWLRPARGLEGVGGRALSAFLLEDTMACELDEMKSQRRDCAVHWGRRPEGDERIRARVMRETGENLDGPPAQAQMGDRYVQ
jgi:hypothetical protein